MEGREKKEEEGRKDRKEGLKGGEGKQEEKGRKKEREGRKKIGGEIRNEAKGGKINVR